VEGGICGLRIPSAITRKNSKNSTMRPFPLSTKTWYMTTYSAISPSLQELSTAAKLVVITGGVPIRLSQIRFAQHNPIILICIALRGLQGSGMVGRWYQCPGQRYVCNEKQSPLISKFQQSASVPLLGHLYVLLVSLDADLLSSTLDRAE
jgi:hypothetical protein